MLRRQARPCTNLPLYRRFGVVISVGLFGAPLVFSSSVDSVDLRRVFSGFH
jgi:hypothetical protein